MYFDSWNDILRVFAVGVPAYAALVVLLRISGKRTLSKLNAFDFVITVAMGSTLATILLSREVSLSEGFAALALLVLLQFVMTWTSMRSERFRKLIKAEPTLLYYRGRFLAEALTFERVSRAEILAASREHGFADLESIGAVVLETDGSLTVIGREAEATRSTLGTVERAPE